MVEQKTEDWIVFICVGSVDYNDVVIVAAHVVILWTLSNPVMENKGWSLKAWKKRQIWLQFLWSEDKLLVDRKKAKNHYQAVQRLYWLKENIFLYFFLDVSPLLRLLTNWVTLLYFWPANFQQAKTMNGYSHTHTSAASHAKPLIFSKYSFVCKQY